MRRATETSGLSLATLGRPGEAAIEMPGLSLATLGRPGEAAIEMPGLSLATLGRPGEAATEDVWPEPWRRWDGPVRRRSRCLA